MIQIQEETIIDTDTSAVFGFLTSIDSLYKIWHPKDHIFCRTISGSLSKMGCRFHFLEIIGGFPLYLIAKVTEVKENEYLEYMPAFPFSLLKTGRAYFRIENISTNQSKLIAYAEYGYRFWWFDKVITFFVKTDTAKKHIREEGENMKKFLENL